MNQVFEKFKKTIIPFGSTNTNFDKMFEFC